MSIPTAVRQTIPLALPLRGETGGVLAGANVQLFAERPDRRMVVVQNQDKAGNSLWIRVGNAATLAAPSLELAAGGTWNPGSVGWVPTGAINIIGTGVAYAAWEA